MITYNVFRVVNCGGKLYRLNEGKANIEYITNGDYIMSIWYSSKCKMYIELLSGIAINKGKQKSKKMAKMQIDGMIDLIFKVYKQKEKELKENQNLPLIKGETEGYIKYD